jgi:tetratricopeptide (TPR) repeat protein
MKFLVPLLALAAIGCGTQQTAQGDAQPSPQAEAPTAQLTPAQSQMESDIQAGAEDLAKLEEAYNAAKERQEKNPGDEQAKTEFLEAAVKFGHESMMSPSLDTKVKYKQALKVYREVLALDPENKVAKQESDLIVQIYESMGRPVPE